MYVPESLLKKINKWKGRQSGRKEIVVYETVFINWTSVGICFITFLSKSVQLSHLPCIKYFGLPVYVSYPVDRNISDKEGLPVVSVSKGSDLFSKLGMAFTRTKNIEKSSCHEGEFSGYHQKWVKDGCNWTEHKYLACLMFAFGEGTGSNAAMMYLSWNVIAVNSSSTEVHGILMLIPNQALVPPKDNSVCGCWWHGTRS